MRSKQDIHVHPPEPGARASQARAGAARSRSRPAIPRIAWQALTALACGLLPIGAAALDVIESDDFPGSASWVGVSVGMLDTGINTVSGSLAGQCVPGDCNRGLPGEDTQDSFLFDVRPGTVMRSLTVSMTDVQAPQPFRAVANVRDRYGFSVQQNLVDGGTTVDFISVPKRPERYGMSIWGTYATVAGPYSLKWTVTIDVVDISTVLPISIQRTDNDSTPGLRSYRILVANPGNADLGNVQLTLPNPVGLENAMWTCDALLACTPTQGTDAVTTTFALGAGESAHVDIVGAVPLDAAFVELSARARVISAGFFNETSVRDPANGIGLFKSGFDP